MIVNPGGGGGRYTPKKRRDWTVKEESIQKLLTHLVWHLAVPSTCALLAGALQYDWEPPAAISFATAEFFGIRISVKQI